MTAHTETITLTDIMKELMAIKARQDIQERAQTNSNSQNWRKNRSQSRSTQERHEAWDSQRRNHTQNNRF